MKRSILLVLFTLILLSLVSGSAQAGKNSLKYAVGNFLRKTQMLPESQKAVGNITRERFRVDSVGVKVENKGPNLITISCVYRVPDSYDVFTEGSINWATKSFKIDLLPGQRDKIMFIRVFDHVKMTWSPDKVLLGTGSWHKGATKKIVIDLERNVVTAFASQIIDVTPPGMLTYQTSVWHPLSLENTQFNFHNPWKEKYRVITEITQGYEVKNNHRADDLGNEVFERIVSPSNKPLEATLGKGRFATFNLPPGTHPIRILVLTPKGRWTEVIRRKLTARGDGSVYDEAGKRMYGPYLMPRSSAQPSASAVKIR